MGKQKNLELDHCNSSYLVHLVAFRQHMITNRCIYHSSNEGGISVASVEEGTIHGRIRRVEDAWGALYRLFWRMAVARWSLYRCFRSMERARCSLHWWIRSMAIPWWTIYGSFWRVEILRKEVSSWLTAKNVVTAFTPSVTLAPVQAGTVTGREPMWILMRAAISTKRSIKTWQNTLSR